MCPGSNPQKSGIYDSPHFSAKEFCKHDQDFRMERYPSNSSNHKDPIGRKTGSLWNSEHMMRILRSSDGVVVLQVRKKGRQALENRKIKGKRVPLTHPEQHNKFI